MVTSMVESTYIAAVLVPFARFVHRVAWQMVSALVGNAVVALRVMWRFNAASNRQSHMLVTIIRVSLPDLRFLAWLYKRLVRRVKSDAFR